MMLSIRSCVCWQSVYLLWRNVYLGLSIFGLGCFFDIELHELFVNFTSPISLLFPLRGSPETDRALWRQRWKPSPAPLPFLLGVGLATSKCTHRASPCPHLFLILDEISYSYFHFLTGDSVYTRESVQQNPPRNVDMTEQEPLVFALIIYQGSCFSKRNSTSLLQLATFHHKQINLILLFL